MRTFMALQWQPPRMYWIKESHVASIPGEDGSRSGPRPVVVS